MSQTKTTIIPGKGTGELMMGMSAEHVKGIIRANTQMRDISEEKAAFLAGGYSIDKVSQFKIGFDSCMVVSNCENYPIFKIYFRNNKLVYITLSSYVSPDELTATFELDKGVPFHATKEEFTKAYGQPEEFRDMKGYDGCLIYWKDGLEVIFENDKLMVISIFEPMK
jgi:hypothetical protein